LTALPRLEALGLTRVEDRGGLSELFGSPAAASLRAVQLSPPPGTRLAEGLQALARSDRLANLLALSVTHSVLTHAELPPLAAAPTLQRVFLPALQRPRLTDASVEVLAGSPVLGNVATLNLAHNGLHRSAARILARAAQLGRVRELLVGGNFFS